MTDQPTRADVVKAVQQLTRSPEGRSALYHLSGWLDALDMTNQDAVVTIVAGGWGDSDGTVMRLMRDAVPVERNLKAKR